MDYEKEYKKLKANIEKAYLFAQTDSTKSVLEHILPELAESEDERTRKEIISFLQLPHPQFVGERKQEKWIAWLEKQGGKKETLCDKCRKEQPSHSCQDITALGRCAIEKLGQQEEPQVYEIEDGKAITYSETDGYKVVEPKFKVGDWIITDKNHIWLIDKDCSTTGYSYRLISQNGKVEVGDYNVVDEHARLWTIQDAKDGDVLATELNGYYPSTFVAIYKEQNGEYFNSHCFVGFNGEFYEGQNGHTNHSIHPATKLQCDLLFQKMTESGYEWDDENKELKHIY